MARDSRNKQTRTGPGSGSPRSRTAARPGERASNRRSGTRPVDPPTEAEQEELAVSSKRSVGNRALSATWRLLLLLVLIATIAATLAQSLRVYFLQADQIAAVRIEIQERHEQIADLNDQLERWEDPQYVEAEARARLGWVMPGEVGYRVIGADGKPLAGEADVLGTKTEAVPGTWAERLWGSVKLADDPTMEEEE